MVQGNRSEKQAGAVVGLHYHLHQADFWYPLRGKMRVVLHDLRTGSTTEGTTVEIDLDGNEDRGVYIPPGIAHGFSTLTDLLLTYMVDSYYNENDERGVLWNDKEIGANWGIEDPILSNRDKSNPLKADLPSQFIPSYPTRT